MSPRPGLAIEACSPLSIRSLASGKGYTYGNLIMWPLRFGFRVHSINSFGRTWLVVVELVVLHTYPNGLPFVDVQSCVHVRVEKIRFC